MAVLERLMQRVEEIEARLLRLETYGYLFARRRDYSVLDDDDAWHRDTPDPNEIWFQFDAHGRMTAFYPHRPGRPEVIRPTPYTDPYTDHWR